MRPNLDLMNAMVFAALDARLFTDAEPSHEPHPEGQPSAPETPELSGSQAGILIVDDRADKRVALKEVLADLRLPIVLAESGVDALRHLLQRDFSVILIDLNMPGMDGIELASLIRKRRRTAKIPIIFFTADAESAAKRIVEAYALGAIDLLVAPIPAPVLRSKVALFADFHHRLEDVQRVAGERERLLHAEAARAEAERASAAKDHFLAMLSHELRTPLSPVINTIQTLLDQPGHPEALREELEMIRRNVALEARLIDDLLDLTRVSRGKVQLMMEPVEVHDCLQSVLKICASEMSEKGVAATVHAAARHSMVRADAARLKQILWNLVRNAIKYSDSGGAVTIATFDEAGDQIRIEVSDAGFGISPELLPGIFDAFRQGVHTTGGLGLGLAISRSLVEIHGGAIEVKSEGRGCGATFTLHFPSFAVPALIEATADAPLRSTLSKSRIAAKVLLVEDHGDSRFTLERLLRLRGYTVVSAESMQRALDLARKSRFDLVISDLGLPDGSGHELWRQIPKHEGLKAIALSGYGMEDDIAKSAAAGFDQHLTKPVDFAALDAAIQCALASSMQA